MAARRTWLLFSNTHKERTIRVPRKMMPTLVTNKFMYNEAGARCIVPSFSRGLTLTAEGTSEASTSHEPVLPSAMLPHRCHFTPSSTAMHPAQDCFASRHAAAACHSAASPEPRVITTHKPRKKASAPCKMSSKHKQQSRFNSCERGKCAMQWTQHGGESMAHPRSSRGSILAAGAFTSHAPQHWAKHRSRASHR